MHGGGEASVLCPGRLLPLTAASVQAVEGLFCSEITWAEPPVAVAFLMWSEVKGSASGESDSVLQKFSLFEGVLSVWGLCRPLVVLCVVLGIFSLGWFWRYLVLAAVPLAACTDAWHEWHHLAVYSSKANPLKLHSPYQAFPLWSRHHPFADSSHLLPGFSHLADFPFLLHSDLSSVHREGKKNKKSLPLNFPVLTLCCRLTPCSVPRWEQPHKHIFLNKDSLLRRNSDASY